VITVVCLDCKSFAWKELLSYTWRCPVCGKRVNAEEVYRAIRNG